MPDESLGRFRRVVAAALDEMERRRQEVNDLNVFPVADDRDGPGRRRVGRDCCGGRDRQGGDRGSRGA